MEKTRRRRDNGEMWYCCRSRFVLFFLEMYDLGGGGGGGEEEDKRDTSFCNLLKRYVFLMLRGLRGLRFFEIGVSFRERT